MSVFIPSEVLDIAQASEEKLIQQVLLELHQKRKVKSEILGNFIDQKDPDSLKQILKESKITEKDILQEVVLKLYKDEKISIGKASRLLNMNIIQFQHLLASHGLYIHYGTADFKQDIETLKRLGHL